MKKIIGVCVLLVVLCVTIWTLIPVEKRKYGLSESALSTDYTALLPTKIERVVQASNREQLQQLVQHANEQGKKITVAGLQHSQGGHTLYEDAIAIDMRTFNQILHIDPLKKTVKVEAGATFDDIQQAIKSYGLALKVTQSQSIFTVGGSLSINAHGRDIRNGSMASQVEEMTWLMPNGHLQTLKKGDPMLGYILGGYGLFGIIVDVTLQLTDDEWYEIHSEEIEPKDYITYFTNVQKDEQIAMHFARISVAPATFLQQMYVIDYKRSDSTKELPALKNERFVKVSKAALDLGRQGGAMENWFWTLQKKHAKSEDGQFISRNNVMRSESTFMEFTKPNKVEVLQEFFVPVDAFEAYVQSLQSYLPANDRKEAVRLHNITIRYVSKDDITQLNYAHENMLAFVVLLQHGTSDEQIEEAKAYIQGWTDITLQHGGTYYLPYYPYQTNEQFTEAYPNALQFKQMKRVIDPNDVFSNLFYTNYIKEQL